MKIRCDVCDNAEATVFCCADEAALCAECDHRVHHANKLASKHSRFSLVHPSFKESPLCDICQERKALLFCQEDRAILCRECDLPIHKANEHTQKHNRFLLTGVKLSASSSLYTISPSTSNCDANINTTRNRNHHPYPRKPSSASHEIFSSPSVETASPPTAYNRDDNHVSDNGSISTSRISEYLETVPGWRIDDFFDPSFATNNGFSKTGDLILPLPDRDLESYKSSFSPEDIDFWVPQVTPQFPQLPLYIARPGLPSGFNESKEASKMKVSRRWNEDGFTVPQISPRSVKHSRHL
ncbi:unnamed protein product [Dovyalis caffra]|uniref:B box-type domain-containing protein n=1 Tax=Dovyalis caffra TaxID=77055 RepID=A0AAV1R9F0_9ROSI|nr:unnamed protein product [Dovyalis caffra]